MISIPTKTFSAALKRVMPAVGSERRMLPVLNNVLLQVEGKELTIAASNLSLSIKTAIAVTSSIEPVALPAKMLNDIVANLAGDVLSLDVDALTNVGKIDCVAYHGELRGMKADEFPPMAEPEGTTITLPLADLQRLTEAVAYAASDEAARPVLEGILLEAKDGKLTTVATDGHRLAASSAAVDGVADARIIAPTAEWQAALKAMSGETIKLALTETMVHLTDGTTSASMPLISGKYPDVSAIIPCSFATQVEVKTADLKRALKSAKIFARELSNIVTITASKQDGLKVETWETVEGRSEHDLVATVSGADITFAINCAFLLETANRIDSDMTLIQTNAANKPIWVAASADSETFAVIAPLQTV